jgi:hypothetical protein
MSEISSERTVQNGRTILTLWLITRLIARNPQDFFIQKRYKIILEKFKKFTNLAEKSLSFDEQDQVFLDKFTQDFKGFCVSFNMVRHQFDSKTMWKDFFAELWMSTGFMKFEQKYAGSIVIPEVKMEDGNMLSISDKLYFFFEDLCIFSKELKLGPSETQLISSLYDSSGLTPSEKDNLLRNSKKMSEMKHQKDKLAAKLTAAESAIQRNWSIFRAHQDEARGVKVMLQQLLNFQTSKNTELEARIAELTLELEGCKQELGKQGLDGIPICHICQEYVIGSQSKLLSCCGYPIHAKCFETYSTSIYPNPLTCPHCRKIDFQLCPLTGNHPLLRQHAAKVKQDFTTSVCEADFLEGVIGGDKIEPILPKERKLSIYELMVRGGAARR